MNKAILPLTAFAILTMGAISIAPSYAQKENKSQESGKMHQDNMSDGKMMMSDSDAEQGCLKGPGGMMMGRNGRMGPGGMMMGRNGRMGPGGMMMGRNGRMGPGGMMPMMRGGGMMGMMGGRGHMGQGHMGHGGWTLEREYTSEEAKRIVDGMLAKRGLSKLKVSKVEEAEKGCLSIQVSTEKGEDIFKLKFDTTTGRSAITQ